MQQHLTGVILEHLWPDSATAYGGAAGFGVRCACGPTGAAPTPVVPKTEVAALSPSRPEREHGRVQPDDPLLASGDVGVVPMFGSHCARVHDKMFALVSTTGDLIVEVTEQRATEFEDAATGARMEMRGRVMREWTAVPQEHLDAWPGLLAEACTYVKSLLPTDRPGTRTENA